MTTEYVENQEYVYPKAKWNESEKLCELLSQKLISKNWPLDLAVEATVTLTSDIWLNSGSFIGIKLEIVIL